MVMPMPTSGMVLQQPDYGNPYILEVIQDHVDLQMQITTAISKYS